MISEERGARSDEMVGGRPPIYRGLFYEFKMRLIAGPRALSGFRRNLLGIVFCCAVGSKGYGAILSG